MKWYKEINELIEDLEKRDQQIREAYRQQKTFEVFAGLISLCVIFSFGILLYGVSGAWRGGGDA